MRWDEFARLRPDLASAGTELLYQCGVRLAFLATIRADGGPRAHPMCPVLTDEGLFPRPTHVTWRSSEVEPRRIVEGRTTGELGRPG